MELTCQECGYTGETVAFYYVCKIGILPMGADEMRQCPQCGARVPLVMADKLEEEEEQIRELCSLLEAIPVNSPEYLLKEASEIIRKLSAMNMRWNIPELEDFLARRQRELGLGMRRK
jgi:hypothetical protein